ncbi:MAG: hypothetical protein WD206_05120 [Actinomycetota bacterium]
MALLFVEATTLSGFPRALASSAIPVAAILMPMGFFFSSMAKGAERPNGFILLLWIGAISLAVGVITLGIGLLAA